MTLLGCNLEKDVEETAHTWCHQRHRKKIWNVKKWIMFNTKRM